MKADRRTTSCLAKESAGQRRKWLLLAAIALITLPSTGSTNAQSLHYPVNTTSDTVVSDACQAGGAGCSLRGAIQVANGHPGADGISHDNLVANAATFPSLPMAMPAFLTVIDDWETALVA